MFKCCVFVFRWKIELCFVFGWMFVVVLFFSLFLRGGGRGEESMEVGRCVKFGYLVWVERYRYFREVVECCYAFSGNGEGGDVYG